MLEKFFLQGSLKTKISLVTLTLFVSSLWALSFFASWMLQSDMKRLLGEQQGATASYAASEVEGKLFNRIKALEMIAQAVDASMVSNPQELQRSLDQNSLLHAIFNAGVIGFNKDGNAFVSSPNIEGRVGVNYLDRDYLIGALQKGYPTIGQPVFGRALISPVFVIAVPVFDADGQIIAALAGVTNLNAPNFLDRIGDSRYGRTGGFSIIDGKTRLVVTATDKSNIMQALPNPGVDPVLDRLIKGEGTEIFKNAIGEVVLVTSRPIPLAGWFLSVRLPIEEAFAPIEEMKRNMMWATLILTVVAGLMTWWALHRQLKPLSETSKTLADLAKSDEPLRPLPLSSSDEIGQVIAGFNRLLSSLAENDSALRTSEAQYRQLYNEVPVGHHEYNLEGRITRVNKTELSLTGYSTEEMIGRFVWEFVADKEQSELRTRGKLAGTFPLNNNDERELFCKDGTTIPALFQDNRCFDEAGKFTGIRTIMLPITERKKAEAALRRSEERYRAIFGTVQDAITVSRMSDGQFIEGNKSFFDLYGYSLEEVSRASAVDLNIWVDLEDRNKCFKIIEQHGSCSNVETRFRKKSGEIFWTLLSATVIDLDDEKCVVAVRRDITERKGAEERINYLAYFDQLTELPNRTLLQDRVRQTMAHSLRTKHFNALMLLDLDHFKTLNDTLGHDMGDLLLKQVAHRLKTCVREEDTVARLGGDEFVVMLSNLSSEREHAASLVELVAGKITVSLDLPFDIRGNEYRTSSSIGASLFRGHEIEVDTLLKQADLAMYKAKETGRNKLRFYDPAMANDVIRRATLESDLREAARLQQFLLHYQAQVSVNQIIGAEVLLRWNHPERGLVPPSHFIAAIEDSGLILSVGRWVLETACKQLVRWASVGKSHLSIAVNISARQMNDEGFVTLVLSILERTGANPHRLKLELTESLLVKNVEQIIGKMNVLKAQGVGFSLDDFGTGYSSLAYLKRLPLDQLKIDQSFVRDILTDSNDESIARMIVVLADSLGLGVIAEGVETREQRDALAKLGCNSYQGYLYGKPSPPDEFEALLMKQVV